MLRAVAKVGRDFVAPELPPAAEDELAAFALAPVVRRDALAWIGRDLGFRKPPRQASALLIRRQLGVQPSGAERRVQAPGDVLLPIAAVGPIAVGVLVGGGEATAKNFARAIERRARFVRAVAAEAPEHLCAALARPRAARDDVDGAAGGAAAVLHGAAAAHDLDALDRVDRDRRKLRRLELVLADAQPIEEHEGVLVAGDAEAAQVELRILRAREIADLQQAELRQDVAEVGRGASADVFRGDDGYADRQVAFGIRKTRGGDHDGIVLRATD